MVAKGNTAVKPVESKPAGSDLGMQLGALYDVCEGLTAGLASTNARMDTIIERLNEATKAVIVLGRNVAEDRKGIKADLALVCDALKEASADMQHVIMDEQMTAVLVNKTVAGVDKLLQARRDLATEVQHTSANGVLGGATTAFKVPTPEVQAANGHAFKQVLDVMEGADDPMFNGEPEPLVTYTTNGALCRNKAAHKNAPTMSKLADGTFICGVCLNIAPAKGAVDLAKPVTETVTTPVLTEDEKLLKALKEQVSSLEAAQRASLAASTAKPLTQAEKDAATIAALKAQLAAKAAPPEVVKPLTAAEKAAIEIATLRQALADKGIATEAEAVAKAAAPEAAKPLGSPQPMHIGTQLYFDGKPVFGGLKPWEDAGFQATKAGGEVPTTQCIVGDCTTILKGGFRCKAHGNANAKELWKA